MELVCRPQLEHDQVTIDQYTTGRRASCFAKLGRLLSKVAELRLLVRTLDPLRKRRFVMRFAHLFAIVAASGLLASISGTIRTTFADNPPPKGNRELHVVGIY